MCKGQFTWNFHTCGQFRGLDQPKDCSKSLSFSLEFFVSLVGCCIDGKVWNLNLQLWCRENDLLLSGNLPEALELLLEILRRQMIWGGVDLRQFLPIFYYFLVFFIFHNNLNNRVIIIAYKPWDKSSTLHCTVLLYHSEIDALNRSHTV